MAYAAQNLKQMKPAERTAWALEMKYYANKLYAERDFKEAMEKYVEALAASNFGTATSASQSSTDDPSIARADLRNNDPPNVEADFVFVSSPQSSSNIDSLIIPVLCNLAACCIELKEFAKALKFSDSAIELRPRCGKALMRRGMALVHIGEYVKGLQALQSALDVKDEGVIEVGRDIVDISDARLQPCMIISETDRYRIPVLIERAERGRAMHQKNKINQASQMKKVFGSTDSVKKYTARENLVQEETVQKGDVAKEAPSSYVSSLWVLLFILILAVVFVYL
jgi:tetratricopeptide (TPR) repeat protein